MLLSVIVICYCHLLLLSVLSSVVVVCPCVLSVGGGGGCWQLSVVEVAVSGGGVCGCRWHQWWW